MTDSLTDYERKVLREIADPGSKPNLSWGAAMSVAVEFLRSGGYIKGVFRPQITDKGWLAKGMPK